MFFLTGREAIHDDMGEEGEKSTTVWLVDGIG